MNDEKNSIDTAVRNEESDILATAVEYMDTFLSEAGNIVTEFRGGRYARLSDLSNLFEGFQWIYIAVNRIKAEYKAEIEIDTQRFTETLKTAEEALKNSDIVLLTDILEYEVIELVQGWFGSR